jgi:hypothetical protein
MLKECKIKARHSKLRQLQWKGRTRGKPRTRWRDKVEENWDVMGMENKQGMVGDRWDCNNNNNNNNNFA